MNLNPSSLMVTAQRRPPIWWLAIALGCVTIALYWPATSHDFINFDDDVYVTANAHVQNGLTAPDIKWAFGNAVTGNWHPLTMLSLMLDHQLYGRQPWGYHLTNVLLHAVNTALVFLWLRGLTGAVWRSALVAALFGWHPVNVESVAWVSERKNVLSLGFGLLALWCYTHYAQGRAAGGAESAVKKADRFYWGALVCLALGLMSKSILVTWPLIMLLLDYWPLNRFASVPARRLVQEKIPFLALVVAAGMLTVLAHRNEGDLMALNGLPLGGRWENALISYCRYLGKLFWPADLAIFYPLPPHWPPGQVWLAGTVLIGISLLVLITWRRQRFLLTGWFWFVIALGPVIGLVQVGSQAMADRHDYIPSIGVWIAVVWSASKIAGRWRGAAAGLPVAGSMAALACLCLTRQQLGYWRDSETLFRRTLMVTQNNYLAHGNLGAALLDEGREKEAIPELREALRLYPDNAKVHNSLGVALMRSHQTDEAILELQKASALNPNYEEAHYNLGLALASKNRIDEAISEDQAALRLNPDDSEAHNQLGLAMAAEGRKDMAISEYEEAIRLKPDYAEAHYNLGTAFLGQGEIDEAIGEFQKAIRAQPDYAPSHNNLGIALTRKGLVDAAIGEFEEAVRLQPEYPKAQDNLARVMALKEKKTGRAADPPNR